MMQAILFLAGSFGVQMWILAEFRYPRCRVPMMFMSRKYKSNGTLVWPSDSVAHWMKG